MLQNVSNAINPQQEYIPNSTLKPIMVYDGACGFCKFWVSRWQRQAADEVVFVPYQQLPHKYFGITRRQFSKSVYLITQYRRLHGAAAVFEVLALGGNDFWNSVYYNFILADIVFEAAYKVIASYRDFFFWLTKIFYKEARHFDAQKPLPF